ncbi:hypothetical protein SAMN05518855_1001307 [Paenibacillus sp. CF384]|nr:hypothetical protein SAMN05518855_1001307 [Paenibacillus sp. CF384]
MLLTLVGSILEELILSVQIFGMQTSEVLTFQRVSFLLKPNLTQLREIHGLRYLRCLSNQHIGIQQTGYISRMHVGFL